MLPGISSFAGTCRLRPDIRPAPATFDKMLQGISAPLLIMRAGNGGMERREPGCLYMANNNNNNMRSLIKIDVRSYWYASGCGLVLVLAAGWWLLVLLEWSDQGSQRKIVSGNRLGLIEALLCDCHIHTPAYTAHMCMYWLNIYQHVCKVLQKLWIPIPILLAPSCACAKPSPSLSLTDASEFLSTAGHLCHRCSCNFCCFCFCCFCFCLLLPRQPSFINQRTDHLRDGWAVGRVCGAVENIIYIEFNNNSWAAAAAAAAA